MMEKLLLVYCIFLWFLNVGEAQKENVARGKPVVGSGKWHAKLVDGNRHSTFAPGSALFPYYFVDLKGLYKLEAIHIYCQNERTFYDQGINQKFDVHVYNKYMAPCAAEDNFPWFPLAYNLTCKRKGEKIELKPSKSLRYIIIGTPNNRYPNGVQPVPLGEIEAYGQKVAESPDPQWPVNTEMPPSHYRDVRDQIIRKQHNIWVEPSGGYFAPNYTLKDVPLAWFDKTVFMAVTRAYGRVIVVMGDRFLREFINSDYYKEIRAGMASWLSKGKPNARFVRIYTNYKDGDILLINRRDRFTAAAVHRDIYYGLNSAVISFPAVWGNDDAKELMHLLRINFVHRRKKMDDQYVGTVLRYNLVDFTDPVYILDRYTRSWPAFTKEPIAVHIDDEWWDRDEVRDGFTKFYRKYGPMFEHIGPCSIKAYWKDVNTSDLIMRFNTLLLHQHGEKCYTLPHVKYSPGVVKPTEKKTSVVVTITAYNDGRYFPTGVYANAGEGFTYTVLESSDWDQETWNIRINTQTDWIADHNAWERWPFLATIVPLKRKGRYCSPHGGLLYLELPQNAKIKIRLEGVYRHAWLDMRNKKTLETFWGEVKQYMGVPWLVLTGDNMDTVMPIREVYNSNASEIIASVNHFDNAIKLIHNFRGSTYEFMRKETFAFDIQISYGAAHAGCPIMALLSWAHGFTQYSNSIKKGGQPGFVHELGHNLQVIGATMKSGTEVTNNVYHFIVHEILLGLDAYAGDDVDQKNWKRTGYHGFGLGYYRYLGKMFGYGLLGNGFTEAFKKSLWLNETRITHFWLTQMCNETGYNLLPFHSLWRVPVIQATRDYCEKLPCFFPDDKYTKANQDIVDRVLQAAKVTCVRNNTKKISFRGNIRRGLDSHRPQNIFLEFS